MNDTDIVKALECCDSGNCSVCPISDDPYCMSRIRQEAVDIIERQQAEIERLNHIRAELSKEIDRLKEKAKGFQELWCEAEGDIRTARAEAIEEFAERLKKEMSFGRYIQADQIDNLVKEMTEGEK